MPGAPHFRPASSHRHTVFVDSTTAIDRIRTDDTGPGQRFAVAAMEACSRILGRDNGATVRWIPAHHGVTGNERADELSTVAAEGKAPSGKVPDEYR